MKKSIELVNTSYGARLVHNLWVPGTENENERTRFSDGQQAAIDLSELCKHGFPDSIPNGTKFTLTMEIPRQKGWYPVKTGQNGFHLIFYFNGTHWYADKKQGTSKWRKDEFSWIGDEPIPDPFEGMS